MNHKSTLFIGFLVFLLASCSDPAMEIRAELNEGIKNSYIGKHTEAIEHFKKVLAIDSTQAEAHLYLGRSYFNQAKYDLSMDEYNRAIQYDPKMGEAFRSRALLWKVLGNQDKFCEDYIKAEDLGVKNLTNYTSKCRKAKLYK